MARSRPRSKRPAKPQDGGRNQLSRDAAAGCSPLFPLEPHWQDWSRDETVAGLWACAKTLGTPISRLPGSPVAVVAQLIGRAVPGVYNKVMNFRSIDPRDSRAGLAGSG